MEQKPGAEPGKDPVVDPVADPPKGKDPEANGAQVSFLERIKDKEGNLKSAEDIASILTEQDKMIGALKVENKGQRTRISGAEKYVEYDSDGNVIGIKGAAKKGAEDDPASPDAVKEMNESFLKEMEKNPISAILKVVNFNTDTLVKNHINPLKELMLSQSSDKALSKLGDELKKEGIDLGSRPEEILKEIPKLREFEDGKGLKLANYMAFYEKCVPEIKKANEEAKKNIKAKSSIFGGSPSASNQDTGASEELAASIKEGFKNSVKSPHSF